MAKKKVKRDILGTINYFLKIVKTIFSLLFIGLMIFIFLGFIGALFIPDSSIGGNVALIQITGKISVAGDDVFSKAGTKSEKVLKWIEAAGEDDNIKAIMLDINSGGGSAVGSEEIAQAIKKSEKPVIAVIREVGASGALWIATAADKIYVNRMSITGSIGVIGSHLEFAGLLKDYNVTYRRLVSGEHKDASSPFKEMTPKEVQMFQKRLDKLHEYFIEAVAKNRGLEVSEVRKMADGFIMLGSEAIEKGLADEVGGIKDAKEYLEKELSVEVEFRKYKERKSIFGLFDTMSARNSYSIGKGLGEALSGNDLTIET